MLRWRPLFKWFDPDNWKWAEAVCAVESGGNPQAIGDNGRAVGLFQMWESFWDDYGPPAYPVTDRMQPLAATLTFFQFWWSCEPLSAHERLAIFHYGAGRARQLAGADPDNYIGRVMRAYQAIEE